jgi:pimeloyl-ACP methyl ester carboxylesterase
VLRAANKTSTLAHKSSVGPRHHRFRGRRIADGRSRRRILNASFATMKDCGHFTYLECPGPVREEIDGFFGMLEPARQR